MGLSAWFFTILDPYRSRTGLRFWGSWMDNAADVHRTEAISPHVKESFETEAA